MIKKYFYLIFMFFSCNSMEITSGDDLIQAAKEGDFKKVAQIIPFAGKFIDYQEEETGNTALIWASHNNYFEIVRLLISCGANINLPNETGTTALEVACFKKFAQKYDESGHRLSNCSFIDQNLIKLLINSGANLNILNLSGSDLLQWASCYGYVKIVQALISRGVNVTEKNLDGYDAMHYAKVNHHIYIMLKLLKAKLMQNCSLV
ncbi:ankyrin repeat domain-containing protein [Candidatus Dependentiae bacterium]|nr:ankyrin repeat domain-containing protein [Candidatus Dependentiae bacterium]